MPKRVIDFDAMWASNKLAACADWAQAEYAWFYGLADASGSFELTNLRVIWGRVAAIRSGLTLERVTQVFEEFARRGLLFTWEENGKRYGHWTGSDVPGRLPAPSWRARLERLAPPVPREALRAYMARFGGPPLSAGSCAGGVREGSDDRDGTKKMHRAKECESVSGSEGGSVSNQLDLKLGVEGAQAQDLDLGLNLSLDWESNPDSDRTPEERTTNCPSSQSSNQFRLSEKRESAARSEAETETETKAATATEEGDLPGQMLAIYETERGNLPGVLQWTHERRRLCALRLSEGLTLEAFREAVRRAAAVPFLAGEGERGWRASFDWLIGNGANVWKVLEGRYDPAGGVAGGAAARGSASRGDAFREASRGDALRARGALVGTGPQAAAFGARVKAAALERNRSRDFGEVGALAAATSLCETTSLHGTMEARKTTPRCVAAPLCETAPLRKTTALCERAS